MELLLVRHGQTAWNAGEIFRGRVNVELDDVGRRQAELLGDYLARPAIDAVYSSPLKRSLDTAMSIAARHNVPVKVSHGLADMSFGRWEGVQLEEVKRLYPADYAVWSEHPAEWKVPGAETLQAVSLRAIAVAEEVAARHSGRAVLVTHRVVVKLLTLALLGLDESSFWNIVVDTCGLTTFRIENGRHVLIRHNDTGFLQGHGRNLKDF